jgi:hypothetical protein
MLPFTFAKVLVKHFNTSGLTINRILKIHMIPKVPKKGAPDKLTADPK